MIFFWEGEAYVRHREYFLTFLLNLSEKGCLVYHGHFPPCAGAQTNQKTDVKKHKKKGPCLLLAGINTMK